MSKLIKAVALWFVYAMTISMVITDVALTLFGPYNFLFVIPAAVFAGYVGDKFTGFSEFILHGDE